MLSDRKATVSYAVDLLRAHQLRRENAFLHAQTQAYHDELTLTKAEVKELKIIVRECRADSEKSQSLCELSEARSDEQADQIKYLQRDLEKLKAETSKHQGEAVQNLADAVAEKALLEEEISRIGALCQYAADTSRSQFQTINDRLDGLEAVLQSKADVAIVESLHRLMDPVPPHHASLDSVSRVDNSVEEQTGIQVHDSQRAYLPETSTILPLKVHDDDDAAPATKSSVQPSIPSDLDLDGNVNTISYAGHRMFDDDENDSLSFLSDPQAPTNELTRANNLMQEKFESWAHYSSRALSLVQTLPATFEEMVVRRFAEGIFQTVQRKQCQQWLELKGWTWDNVGSFGSVSSQVPQAPGSNIAPSVELSAGYSKRMGLLLEQKRSTTRRTSNTLAGLPPGHNEKCATMPLRRSQRLMEKSIRIAMDDAAKIPVAFESHVLGGKIRKNIPTPTLQKRKGKYCPKEALRASGEKVNKHLEATAVQTPAATKDNKADGGEGEAQLPAMCNDNEEIGQRQSQQGPPVGNSKKPRGRVTCVPRLVPQKRAPTETASESSSDEGYLYQQPIKRNEASEMPVTKHRCVERRLPLPPPPEIPILSTSSDG